MFCPNCGKEVEETAAACPACGASLKQEAPPADGSETPSPGAPPPGGAAAGTGGPSSPFGSEPKKKLVAALLGIFVGWAGVHRFYLGYNTIGIIQVVLSVLGIFTCGITTLAAAIWGIVEGILIMTGNINKDAQGRPIVD